MRVDECGCVDEIVAVWTQGAVWNRTAVLRKSANRHVDWPKTWPKSGRAGVNSAQDMAVVCMSSD